MIGKTETYERNGSQILKLLMKFIKEGKHSESKQQCFISLKALVPIQCLMK